MESNRLVRNPKLTTHATHLLTLQKHLKNVNILENLSIFQNVENLSIFELFSKSLHFQANPHTLTYAPWQDSDD